MDFGAFAKAVGQAARGVSRALGGEVVPIPDELEGPAAILFPVNFIANTRLVTAAGLAIAGGSLFGAPAASSDAAGAGAGGADAGGFFDHLGSKAAKLGEEAASAAVKNALAPKRQERQGG